MVRQKEMTSLQNLTEGTRIAAADEKARNSYWKPSHDYSSNPMSPCKKESLRGELLGRQYYLGGQAAQKLDTFTTKSQAVNAHGPERLDTTKQMSDFRVQDLLSQPGVRQRLATNIPDSTGARNNVNKLRFQREQAFVEPLLKDAGTVYTTNACIGNWVEERRDPDFKSGFHARELGMSKIYQSEHMDRYTAPSTEYQSKVQSMYRTARLPSPQGPPKDMGGNANYVYYARGFGDTPYLDHTAPGRRGVFWLGTAPVRDHESITTTAAAGEPLEFQHRVSLMDPKSKVLTGTMSRQAEQAQAGRATDTLLRTQRHTSAWKSMYTSEIHGRSSTPMGFRSTSVSADWAAAKASATTTLDRPYTSKV